MTRLLLLLALLAAFTAGLLIGEQHPAAGHPSSSGAGAETASAGQRPERGALPPPSRPRTSPPSRSEQRKPLRHDTTPAHMPPFPQPWQALAECESSGHWDYGAPGRYTDGDGYEGGLNFAPTTWTSFAPANYPTHAYSATVAQQIAVARRVLAVQGWAAWPACSSKLGLR